MYHDMEAEDSRSPALERDQDRARPMRSPVVVEDAATRAPVRKIERIRNMREEEARQPGIRRVVDRYNWWRALYNANVIKLGELDLLALEEQARDEQCAMAYKASFEMENMIVPNSYNQAMKSSERSKWKSAIFE